MNDLIYRQHAINALENTDCELSNDAWNELTNAIKQAPSAEQWISVTDRLPEYDGWYLCTIKNDIETKVAQIRFFEDIKWKAYG